MSFLGESWRRLIFLLRRSRMDRELEEEMRCHAALKEQKHMAAGMDAEEAGYAARRQLGNLTRQREESRQLWGFPFLESMAQDIRYGLRGLRKAPGFTTVAALTLALGIGSCTAIFSIVNDVLLRPLPYKDSSRMVVIGTETPMFPEFHLPQAIPNANDIKAEGRSFEATTLYMVWPKNLTGDREPEQLQSAAVAPDFFIFFGVHPLQGREFVAADEQGKNGDVALVSYGLWQRRFASDPGIVGSRITLDDKLYTIVGVLPPEFSYPAKTDVWVPLAANVAEQADRQRWLYSMLAKLRSGVSVRNAQSELDSIAAGIARQHPAEASGIKFSLETLHGTSVGEEQVELLVLTGAVGFLLLIACANVGNLVLARGLMRQKEIAVRAALGASRGRIARQLLIESFLLAFAGGVAGASLATLGVDAFRALAPTRFPRLEDIRVEPSTILIAFTVTMFTGILCGLAPALSASRANLNPALKEKMEGATLQRVSLRTFLVVTEMALALVLLTGSGLMVQSLVRILKVDTGMRIDHVLLATLSVPQTRYPSDESSQMFAHSLLDALRAQPQFSGAALSDFPVMDGTLSAIFLNGPTLAAFGMKEQRLDLEARKVSPGFFETLAIPMVRGRFFNDQDVKGARPVIIINDSVARRFFPEQDPIGKTLKLDSDPAKDYQIAGQVADTRDVDLQGRPELQVYFPLLQSSAKGMDSLSIMVRTAEEPANAIESLRRAVASIDKDLPITKVQSITQEISESVAEPRFRAGLLSAFAVSGLALSLIGIYGVVSYSVGRRTQEMGIRMALGAQPGNVVRLVLREGVILALIGAVCGLIGSFSLTWTLASQLYGIKPKDPATLAGAAVLVLIIALAASYMPARRATKVDPMIALRYE